MPFGGSLCTSLAQRQSDAVICKTKVMERQGETNDLVRDFLPVESVGANMVAMLDDFLVVVPRKPFETDDQLLMPTEACTTRFDDLLQKLGLPKAAEKDPVVWFGIRFCTKSGIYGMPAEKWMNLRLYVESKLMSKAGEVGVTVDASSLLTVLGKFHHATLT